MAETKAIKKRLPLPQVLVIENAQDDTEELEREYTSVLEGVIVKCFEFFGLAQDFASNTFVDFAVIRISFGTNEKTARRWVSTISILCPEATIILLAHEGFNAHDARIKAVVPRYPLTALAAEIKKRIPAQDASAG